MRKSPKPPGHRAKNGDVYWVDEAGLFHRDDGPAFITAHGATLWYSHGRLHRVDGPAVETTTGQKFWYVDGVFDRSMVTMMGDGGESITLTSTTYETWSRFFSS